LLLNLMNDVVEYGYIQFYQIIIINDSLTIFYIFSDI